MNDALGTKPKKDKKKEKELPGWRKSGFGLSWGRVVHYIRTLFHLFRYVGKDLSIKAGFIMLDKYAVGYSC